MLLASPPSYITTEQFRAMPLDYSLTDYSDPQIQDILNRASGAADAIMRRSLLARERIIRYIGDGTNKLSLDKNPILYVKRVQIVIPGTTGMLIPTDELLIDYQAGSMAEYTPLLWQGQGYFSRFPADTPVDVTIGYGYGSNIVSSPTWTSADASGPGLTPGSYDVAVATKTMWGQTIAAARTVVTTTGNILITISPVLGAYLYCGYAAAHGQPLKLVNESPLTKYGAQAMQIEINSLTPQNGLWPDALPTTDTSAPELPAAIIEAVRLLALDMLYGQNNLANRGIAKTESGRKSVMWHARTGNSANFEQARTLLRPYSFQGIL